MSPRKPNPELASTRREALIRAGYAEVVEKGLARFTLEAVARRAGSSKGGSLHYFRTKEEVLGAILEWVLEQLSRSLDEAVAAQTSPRAQLAAELELLFHSAELNRKFYRVLLDFLSAAAQSEMFRRQLASFYRKCHERDRQIVQAGIEKNQFRPVDPDGAAYIIRGMVDGLCAQWLVREASVSWEALRDSCRAALGAYLLR